jgi:hypothetical protein
MKNKTIVYEYVDEISYYIPRHEKEKVAEAINIHLVGTNDINIATKNGGLKENPKVTKHPNYDVLVEAHCKMSSTSLISVKIRIYSDGTKDMIPMEKP